MVYAQTRICPIKMNIYIYIYIYTFFKEKKTKTGYFRIINLFPSYFAFLSGSVYMHILNRIIRSEQLGLYRDDGIYPE